LGGVVKLFCRERRHVVEKEMEDHAEQSIAVFSWNAHAQREPVGDTVLRYSAHVLVCGQEDHVFVRQFAREEAYEPWVVAIIDVMATIRPRKASSGQFERRHVWGDAFHCFKAPIKDFALVHANQATRRERRRRSVERDEGHLNRTVRVVRPLCIGHCSVPIRGFAGRAAFCDVDALIW